MYKFKSAFAIEIEAMLKYRQAFGHGTDFLRNHLVSFDAFTAGHMPDENEITRYLVVAYMDNQCSCNTKGLREKLFALRTLAKYVNSTGGTAFVPPMSIIPRQRKYSPYVFTDEELTMLFEAMDEMRQGHWDPMVVKCAPVLFRLIYTCGLRPREGYWLKTQNVDFKTGEIRIEKSKKNKDRLVVMSEDMKALMLRYKDFLDKQFPGSEYLFVNRRGERCCVVSLRKFFWASWVRALKTKGVKKAPHVRVYDLRHRFASCVLSKWANKGDDVFAKLPFLRAYMGHSTLDSTLYYVHILPAHLTKSQSFDWQKINQIIPTMENDNEYRVSK